MKTEVLFKMYNHVFSIGYPMVIAQLYEHNSDQLLDLFFIIGNYNKRSELKECLTYRVDHMIKAGLEADVILEFIIDAKVRDYENELRDLNKELINDHLPLEEINIKSKYLTLSTLKGYRDIKLQISSKTASSDVRAFVNNIEPIEVEFSKL